MWHASLQCRQLTRYISYIFQLRRAVEDEMASGGRDSESDPGFNDSAAGRGMSVEGVDFCTKS